MVEIPSPEKVASLVSNVTETMFGISFEPVVPYEPSPQLIWRTVLLPIPGKYPITVGLSSDRAGCIKLGSAMFQVPIEDVDPSMMDDSLCELANMTAGLLKSTLSLDQALGLPHVIPEGDPRSATARGEEAQLTVLRAKEVGLVLWILQGVV